jgi:hypothetical protein
MANLNVVDPALSKTFVVLIQVSEGAPSITVRLPEASGLSPASFGPEEYTQAEQAANQASVALLLQKAKNRWASMAAENGNTISWIQP